MELNQYQIILVNLDPTIGHEIKKTRPCVVISPNEMNQYLETIVIAPMTSASKSYPSRVKVNHKGKTGWIVLDQLRSVDRQRIIKAIEILNEKEIIKVKEVIKELYVD
jgi:mRNA interferase MazF